MRRMNFLKGEKKPRGNGNKKEEDEMFLLKRMKIRLL
jgi:hypothetical protein